MMFPVMKNEKKLHWVKLAVGAFLLALLGTGCLADAPEDIDRSMRPMAPLVDEVNRPFKSSGSF